jgi:hypothetical protein
MFHRRNRIMLAAGITIAVIAAMADPAGARASAGGQASTPVPANITGDITWTWDHTPQPPSYTVTGDEKQTGTFHIVLTNVTPAVDPTVGGSRSTYSITDNTNLSFTENHTGCTQNWAGNFSGSGPLPYAPHTGLAGISLEFNPSMTAVTEVNIGVSFTETQTVTLGGPSSLCNSGTLTQPAGLEANPSCFDGSNLISPSGSLNGTYPNATVNLGCSGTVANCPPISNCPNETGSYSVTGTLKITPSCGSGAAASPGLLCITSPPDNSTIAISDPQFVDGAEVGFTDRAPALNKLKLKVSGTSTCPGRVTVNGVSATSSGNEWTAEVPITALAGAALGRATLTAKASGCNDTSSTVTLINLKITDPRRISRRRSSIQVAPVPP